MNQTRRPAAAAGARGTEDALLSPRGWAEALAAVAAGLAAMLVLAALGLWAAGATGLPGGAFLPVVAATVVMAVGGKVALKGDAGGLAEANASLDAVPLSVTVAGALAVAVVFLWPLRHRAVAGGTEVIGRVIRTAVLWLLGLLVLSLIARHDFRIPVGGGLADLGEITGSTPKIGFRANVGATMGIGLLFLLVVLALAFAVSRKAPLPSRLLPFQQSVRPSARALVLVLLGYVALGLVAGVVALIGYGHRPQTLAVMLLALPNLVWMALGLGLGGAWEGHVEKGIGLPMPKVLDQVLAGRGNTTLDIAALGQQDGRAWLLAVVAAAALITAGFLAAVRSPARTRPWQLAWHTGVALAVTLLVVGLLTRLSARYGLTLIGVGDLGGGLGGSVALRPQYLLLVGFGALWGLVAGALGSLLAARVRRSGQVAESKPESEGTRRR